MCSGNDIITNRSANDNMKIEITEASAADILPCAKMIAATDPWLAFKYSVEDCIPKVKSAKWLKVAKAGNELAGFISYKPEGMGAMSYISLLCIAPEYQRKGVGGKLLKHAEDHIFTYDHNIMLYATSFNHSAISFYEKNGYKKVGEITDYNYTGHHEYMYRKTIGPRRQDLKPE